MSRLLPSAPSSDELDPIRLGAAIELDRVTDNGRNAASPAYPKGGMVKRYADELGVSVDELLEWGAAQGA